VAHSITYERRRQAAIEALWENVSAFRTVLLNVPPDVRILAIETFEAEATRLLGPASPLLREMSRALRHGQRRTPGTAHA
jgi:hypothetical protein